MTHTELSSFREKVQAKKGDYEFGKYHQNFVYPRPEQDKMIQVINQAITQQDRIDQLTYEVEKLRRELKNQLVDKHY